MTVSVTADAVSLEGTFYVELVSPYSMSSDEYYRSLPLVQKDFAIALNRQVNALASTGIELFITRYARWQTLVRRRRLYSPPHVVHVLSAS